jgi:hypothetical protein
METYELFVYITKETEGVYTWGIGQELNDEEFEFLAGGEEETLEEASHRISEEIKTLF